MFDPTPFQLDRDGSIMRRFDLEFSIYSNFRFMIYEQDGKYFGDGLHEIDSSPNFEKENFISWLKTQGAEVEQIVNNGRIGYRFKED